MTAASIAPRETESSQRDFFRKAVQIGSMAVALALTGCEKRPVRIVDIPGANGAPVPTVAEVARHAIEVEKIDACNFEKRIAAFVLSHPDRRITDIEGNGSGMQGRNDGFTIVTREARPGEPLQSLNKIIATDSTEAAYAYRSAYPERVIDALVGSGDGMQGQNEFYVVVSSQDRAD